MAVRLGEIAPGQVVAGGDRSRPQRAKPFQGRGFPRHLGVGFREEHLLPAAVCDLEPKCGEREWTPPLAWMSTDSKDSRSATTTGTVSRISTLRSPGDCPTGCSATSGNGQFADASAHAGLDALDGSSAAFFSDIENNGTQDLIVILSTGQPLLFLNGGRGEFRWSREGFPLGVKPRCRRRVPWRLRPRWVSRSVRHRVPLAQRRLPAPSALLRRDERAAERALSQLGERHLRGCDGAHRPDREQQPIQPCLHLGRLRPGWPARPVRRYRLRTQEPLPQSRRRRFS